jgi:hypothetical protein
VSASTVPAVRAALLVRCRELLTAAGDTATKVTYGHPGQDIPKRFVGVASTADGLTREQRTLPLRPSSSRTEEYGINLLLWNSDGSPDKQQQVTEDCWATFDLIDTGLRVDPTLGKLVTSALITRAVDDDFLLTEGRAAQIVATVSVTCNRA